LVATLPRANLKIPHRNTPIRLIDMGTAAHLRPASGTEHADKQVPDLRAIDRIAHAGGPQVPVHYVTDQGENWRSHNAPAELAEDRGPLRRRALIRTR